MKSLGEANTDFERRAEAAIWRIPEFADHAVRYGLAAAPVASPVHRATASDCVRIERGKEPPVFLKVLQPDAAFHLDYAQVAKAARVAATRGVAPPLLIDQAAGGILGFEMLGADWRHATMGDLSREGGIDPVLAAKKRLHDGPPIGWRFDVFDRIDILLALSRQATAPLPDDLGFLHRNTRLARAAIEAAGYDLRLCHNDGVASNVMLGPQGAVLLVDFDLAGDNDPWFDVGVLLNEVFQFTTDKRAAIERLAGRFDERLLNRCELYAAADDLMWGLWGCLMGATSPRNGIEFFKYGQWRLLRCRLAMLAPAFEEHLRRV
ncbi:MAG TPA: phosphotransferase [Ancylobacter sp.]